MHQSKKIPELRIIILVGWCLLFLRCKTTDTSMIRAVVLAKSEESYRVGLLYHFQEPTADSSDVENQISIVWSGADTMEQAFAQAEEQLSASVNYRLCDYLFLPVDAEYEMMSEYEELVLHQKCGRIAARVCFLDLSSAEIGDEDSWRTAPFQLMETAAKYKKEMPYLYQWSELCLLPLFHVEGTDDLTKMGSVLCSKPQKYLLDEEDESVIRLLMEKADDVSLWLDGTRVSIRKCVVSVTLQQERVDLVLDCQPSYGTSVPTQEQISQLQERCTKTVYNYWERGIDLLNLKAKSALQRGLQKAISPEKNACPQLQTDVRVLMA